MIGRWLLWLPVGICAVLAPCWAMAANGIPENAANGDPCGGIRPRDLGRNFTIDEMLKQKPYPIRGVCESRCFWQAVVTNSCFYPDAVIDIHAPVNASTGQLNRLAAVILISETRAFSGTPLAAIGEQGAKAAQMSIGGQNSQRPIIVLKLVG